MVENLLKRRRRLLEELSWLNWFWWRSCKSKRRYLTLEAAGKQAILINKQRRNQRHPNKVYQCKFPHKVRGKYVAHFHIGHPPKRK